MVTFFRKVRMRRNLLVGIGASLLLVCLWLSINPRGVDSSEVAGDRDAAPPAAPAGAGSDGVVNVVVVGATGDLAKKYLWQGFFNLAYEESAQVFHFFAGARSPQEKGEREMKGILSENVSCDRLPESISRKTDNCEQRKAAFGENIPYYNLKKTEDYKTLCGDIQRKMQGVGLREKGRIIYLSVPPFAYADIAASINTECRPLGDACLRVVVEKPFGHDTASAKELSGALKQHLKESEIYRIDHYLGKTGVQSILPFRVTNREKYGELWDQEHIERVEIVMKEALDVKGRISFYDKYGVIRDVMQNHLTEIMALVAMEIPRNLSDSADKLEEKLAVLSQVAPATARQAVIGQYSGYGDEWREEMDRGQDESTNTPTYAAVRLSVSNPRWGAVPFVLVAGKKLDEKLVYVRILFKNTDICATTPDYANEDHACQTKQIIFFIGSSKLPTVAVSKSLPRPAVPVAWTVPGLGEGTNILGYPLSDFYVFSAGAESDPYSSLIRECYHGNQDKFIGTPDLMASWDIWTSLLQEITEVQPRIYLGGKGTGRWLDFKLVKTGLSFIHQVDTEWNAERGQQFALPSMSGISRTFRSDRLFTGDTEETVALLAMHILHSANNAISERGVFHVAFPGGSTPGRLFMYLAMRMRNTFPWTDTHIWFTDERCVTVTSPESNFNLIYTKLLRYVSILYTNIHPMPVQLAKGLCHPDDNGAGIYSAEMGRLLPDSRFDYIVLGVGNDGHIASLFPNPISLYNDKHLVVLTEGSAQMEVRHRMSLSFLMINKARNVAIHVLGEKKQSLVETLRHTHHNNRSKLPVLEVDPSNGELTWFIDHSALLSV
ncbi:GDH/6PGL endoplasmic bifunctional protein-like [Diadema antillarum]|uniref:GDH/6PGL endoplasmic bifunctional protein-like n=1 Tax=Diadema antillarum TaxID=105358 RepID=UPI003A88F2A0